MKEVELQQILRDSILVGKQTGDLDEEILGGFYKSLVTTPSPPVASITETTQRRCELEEAMLQKSSFLRGTRVFV